MISDTLPAMMTRPQTAAFLQCSVDVVDRMIERGEIKATKLGTGRTSPVRIHRDTLLRDLGLIDASSDRRRRRAAEAERHLAEAGR